MSLTLAVTKRREILGIEVSTMPAKGLLSTKAIAKYGYRKDGRKKALFTLLRSLKGVVHEQALFESDKNPHYPGVLKRVFPQCTHHATLSHRGAIVGQGELKKVKWDPLFSLNHTAAMCRGNVNRLFRRTWCTTKKAESLTDHLALYTQYHNEHLAL